MQNSDKVRYSEMKKYTHNSYVNGEDYWNKTLSAALNMLVNWKGGKKYPEQQYEYNKGMGLTTKANTRGFRGDFQNCGKSGHMAWDCPEPRKEECGN